MQIRAPKTADRPLSRRPWEPDQILGLIQHNYPRRAHMTVLTGAGISADSGVPTFRGTDGLVAHISRGGSRDTRSV